MKFGLLPFIFILFSTHVFAQKSKISGFVYDGKTKQPLEGATIILKEKEKTTSTNSFGQFVFENAESGNFTISVSYIGYEIWENTVLSNQPAKIYLSAKPIDLTEVNVTNNKISTVQLINAVDIKLRPINNSQEILRMVPGLFIGQHAGGGKAEQIFLRGFDLDHGTDIRLTVDGMPVNMVSHAHGQGYADLHFVIPELVESVQFKKGPYFADRGNLTTAGFVNFKTREVLDKSIVKIEGGQFNTFRGFGAFDLLSEKARQKNQSAYVASEYSYSDSYFDAPQHFKRFNLLGKYNGQISKNTFLSFTASTFWSKWNHSGQIPDRAVASGLISHFGAIDSNEGGETSRTNINTEFKTLTANGNVIKNQFFYSNYHFELYSNFTFFKEDTINGDQIRQKEKRDLVGYNGSYSKNFYVGNTEWASTVGANIRYDATHNTELSRTKDRTIVTLPIKLGDINEFNGGVYLDEMIELSSKFTINAGLRYDVFRNRYLDKLDDSTGTPDRYSVSTIFCPKLNFYFTPNSSFQFYLNTGKSFHSNDTRVVVAQNGKKTLPAAYGTDLGVIFKPTSKLLINTALWYLWLDQEFVYVGDEGVIEPGGRTRRMGFDISLRYQLTDWLYADADFNTTKPRSIDDGNGNETLAGENYLPLAPLICSTGGLTVNSKSGFSGSLRYRYMGDRPANEDNSIVAKGYFISDAVLRYTKSRYDVNLQVTNIFNTLWKETQFATESRLKGEPAPVTEIHFTAGSPFFAKLSMSYFF